MKEHGRRGRLIARRFVERTNLGDVRDPSARANDKDPGLPQSHGNGCARDRELPGDLARPDVHQIADEPRYPTDEHR